MVELIAKTPCSGLLPIRMDGLRLEEVDLGRLTSVSPYAGRQAQVASLLEQMHGVPYPPPNTSAGAGNDQVIWFGRDTALLIGPAPDKALETVAAITDQSDAWAAVVLSGTTAEDVLARLVPVDLRPSVFAIGQTCRTLCGHMSVSITRRADGSFLIFVFRSMAVTFVEELHEAMEAVAARG